jgi:hypothetical protein
VDQTTLVDEKVRDGKRLLDQFSETGFPVIAAGWIRETDRYYWHLYVVSPVVDTEGKGPAYRRIHPLLRQMPQPFSIAPLSEVKALGPHEPLAKAMLDLQRRYPGRSYFHFGGSQFGGVAVEVVYLYPSASVPDQTDGQASAAK